MIEVQSKATELIAKSKDPKYCPEKCPKKCPEKCPKWCPYKDPCTWFCWITVLAGAFVAFLVLSSIFPYLPVWRYNPLSSSAVPIVIYCERAVTDVDAYKSAFGAFATSTQSSGKGVLMFFSYMSMKVDGKALQLSMFTDADAYLAQPFSSADVDATYDASGENFCQVYGGWNDAVKAAQSAVTTSHFGTGAGFIRSAGEVGYGYEHADTPLIMISKRGFQKGKGAGTSPIFQHITDMIYPVAPGCIAAFDFPSLDGDEDYSWSLRIFSSYTRGFLLHIYGNILTAPTLALTLVPRWASPIFPVGNSFSTGGDIAGAIAGFPGNAVYTQYTFDGMADALIGPAPALSKAAP